MSFETKHFEYTPTPVIINLTEDNLQDICQYLEYDMGIYGFPSIDECYEATEKILGNMPGYICREIAEIVQNYYTKEYIKEYLVTIKITRRKKAHNEGEAIEDVCADMAVYIDECDIEVKEVKSDE